MKLTKSRLKQIIKEEISNIDQQEYEDMYAQNEATELLELYNSFVDSIRDNVTWHSALIELDKQIRDKIELIQMKLNDLISNEEPILKLEPEL